MIFKINARITPNYKSMYYLISELLILYCCVLLQGRNSTPLHLAAGYNNVEVAEFLLQNGADVNAQDKGGLIPMHNASSYGVSSLTI